MSIVGLIIVLFGLTLLGGSVVAVTLLWTKVRVLERRVQHLEGQLALRVENEEV